VNSSITEGQKRGLHMSNDDMPRSADSASQPRRERLHEYSSKQARLQLKAGSAEIPARFAVEVDKSLHIFRPTPH
jgi:hypothetical protein